MKRLLSAIFLLCLPVFCHAAELGAARFSLIKGDVQVFTEDTQEWVAATVNFPLKEGDRIWVPAEARSEVHIQGGVYLRLDSQSALDILNLDEESFQFYLQQGHAYINNRKGGIDHIQVDTPLSSIGCFDSSLVMIDVTDSGATTASVLKGSATAETRGGKTRVAAGNALLLNDDLSAESFPLDRPDAWERWNRKQDLRLADTAESLRYLPDELDDYAAELDANGSWVHVAEYGYVWTPRVTVTDWSPYRTGRWVWIRGDYVWVTYEPWGWAPHHYGRWVYLAGPGWCWVPPGRHAVHWGPGYVGWVHTESHVGWVPLAPAETYYARRAYGPGSINVTINQTIGRPQYRNAQVRSAVIVQPRETFLTGRRVREATHVDLFRQQNAVFGPHVVRGERRVSVPVVRTIPRERRPPERVQAVPVERIRKERRIIREDRGSVFTPERQAAPLPVQTRTEPLKPSRAQQPPPVKTDRDRRRGAGREHGQAQPQPPAVPSPAVPQTPGPGAGQKPAPPPTRSTETQPAVKSPPQTAPGERRAGPDRDRGQRGRKQEQKGQAEKKGRAGKGQEPASTEPQPRGHDGDGGKPAPQRGRDRD
jgi:hypothetical protein